MLALDGGSLKATRFEVPVAMADDEKTLAGVRLTTPKAAAIAGVVFSLLLIIAFAMIRSALPADPMESGAWLSGSSRRVTVALSLVPFAGIAFLWFLGVLRARVKQLEDRFFATIFLGSGLLFLALLFSAAAIVGALILSFGTPSDAAGDWTTFHFGRAAAYILMNVYAMKMAAVFMITTSTVILYTAISPRWTSIVGFLLAPVLLLGSFFPWSLLALPIWVLLVSASILAEEFHRAG